MKPYTLNSIYSMSFRALARNLTLCIAFFVFHTVTAQVQPRVSSSIDSTQIKIGEQLQFKVEVEADTTAQVIFPEGQTFSPLEVVEESAIDTLINQDRINLIKKYALTQFDSGSYTLPQQQILINEKPYFTDSLNIEVRTVAVDTTKQKMYDIKPLVEVDKTYGNWLKYILYGLLILALIGGVLYWFVFRKKALTEEEKEALLPPYERAILALKNLDESRHLIQSEYKTYYSLLTAIVRSYLEEEANISALESTTNELIEKMELLKDSGNLDIGESTIKQFENVLQVADLVKFARSQPATRTAEDHRKFMEQIIVNVKEALPEPSEEELLENEEYLATLEKKKKRKRMRIAVVAASVVIVLTTVGLVWHYGFTEVKDSLIGHPVKELLEGEWVASEYGYPSVFIETPKVLKRTETELPEDIKTAINTHQVFSYGNVKDNFYIMLSATTYKKDAEATMKAATDATLAALENKGAKNIVVKEEDFTTQTGIGGKKIFGSMNIDTGNPENPDKGEYVMLNFTQNGGFQQIIIVHESEDEYALKITERIINSIDFKTGT